MEKNKEKNTPAASRFHVRLQERFSALSNGIKTVLLPVTEWSGMANNDNKHALYSLYRNFTLPLQA
ncbi:MAG: hypothetical protein IJG42_12115 [Muribaculaceae bacterium]|nr:hypothetical protein [Muribaculaceae bacterium]